MNGPGSQQRMYIALLLLTGAAVGVGLTIDAGKYRSLAWVLLGFFAFRVVIGRMRSKQHGDAKADGEEVGRLETVGKYSNRKS